MRDVSEARTPEKLAPFIGREKMRGDREERAPLLAVRIVAIVVDQDPGRSALAQNAIDFFQPRGGIGPVVGRFDGDRVGEEVRFPRNLGRLTNDKEQIVVVQAGPPSPVHHLVRNVHSDDAAFRDQLCKPPRKPAGAAADIQHVVSPPEAHLLEHRQRDGEMLVLHALAAPGLGPAIKFAAQ